MSVCTIARALDRIKHTTPDSPLIVASAKRGYVEVFFRNTVYGQDFVRFNPPNLLGVFHGGMDMNHVRSKLEKR